MDEEVGIRFRGGKELAEEKKKAREWATKTKKRERARKRR